MSILAVRTFDVSKIGAKLHSVVAPGDGRRVMVATLAAGSPGSPHRNER